MFGRAVQKHSAAPAAKIQRPLHPNPAAANVPNPQETKKRKFARSMSSTSNLGALHDSTYFYNENDFEDDGAIDLTGGTPPKRKASSVDYPSLSASFTDVDYPVLPPAPVPQANHTQAPASSAPLPWSSSPPSHYQPPPSKRRTVPWLDKNGNDRIAAYTPLPADKNKTSTYPWNRTASALKDEQKELRKRNRLRGTQIKPEATAALAKKSSTTQVPTTFLSEEQRGILKAVVEEGKSVFFTGSAGTGKSVLMKQIIAKLRDKYVREPDRVAVTASTGLAACHIEGTTLHSFAGAGLAKEPAPELVKKIKRNAKTKSRWQRTKVLIIDEISMVDGDLYDKLEHIARAIRNNGRPFGGIQLVITGDFFQLPPVPDKGKVAKFSFDAATWNTTIEHTILLTHVFRQKDPTFANMLNEIRLGKLTPASIKEFQRLSRPLRYEDEISATELFPLRNEVDNANGSRMNMLSGEAMEFHALDSGSADPSAREKLLAQFMAQPLLKLKKGAQVMLIKNIDSSLVNGSLGIVQAFMDENCFNVYTRDEEAYLQAQKPDGGSDDENNAKARKKITAALYKNNTSLGRKWPLVRFSLPDGTSRDLLCQPEDWKTEAPGGELLAKRIQVPLILAWALSIHKAQGQTIERIKVDLGKVFEKGQAYVALSRATSQEGLQVLRFDPRKVMVHPKVIQFYSNLVTAGSIQGQDVEHVQNTSTAKGMDQEAFGHENESEEEAGYMYM